jgi:hypothetical protein
MNFFGFVILGKWHFLLVLSLLPRSPFKNMHILVLLGVFFCHYRGIEFFHFVRTWGMCISIWFLSSEFCSYIESYLSILLIKRRSLSVCARSRNRGFGTSTDRTSFFFLLSALNCRSLSVRLFQVLKPRSWDPGPEFEVRRAAQVLKSRFRDLDGQDLFFFLFFSRPFPAGCPGLIQEFFEKKKKTVLGFKF